MFKVRIFQPIVPEYRTALFNGLGERYGENIEVWASAGEGQDKSYPLQATRYDYNHPLVKFGSLRWQRGFSLRGLKKGDVVVICGDVHQLSSLWVAVMAKSRGIGVVWWGHHRTSTSTEIRVKIRLAIAKRLSDTFLAYTKTGVKYLEERGFKHGRVFATGNTIDMKSVELAIAEWTNARLQKFQVDQCLNGKEVIVFCSVLRWKTHLEHLLKAMASNVLRFRGVRLVVIGDGEGRIAWENLAKELGIANRVIWAGVLRDQKLIAPWFLSAKAYVYPGPIGLSVIHAFSYGLPVICHSNAEHHGPEFEAMEDGKNGLCFKEGDVEDLADKIVSMLDDDERLAEMSRCAKETASHYTMDAMVTNFAEAIEATHRDCQK